MGVKTGVKTVKCKRHTRTHIETHAKPWPLRLDAQSSTPPRRQPRRHLDATSTPPRRVDAENAVTRARRLDASSTPDLNTRFALVMYTASLLVGGRGDANGHTLMHTYGVLSNILVTV